MSCSSFLLQSSTTLHTPPDTTMRCCLFLVVAAIVVAYQMQETEAKFSFSLPGKWGGAKRGGSFSFSLPGKWGGQAGKRSGDLGACGEVDPETMYYIYSIIQVSISLAFIFYPLLLGTFVG